jgi:hypothetical protein
MVERSRLLGTPSDFCMQGGYLLNPNDVKPGRDETDERYIIAPVLLSTFGRNTRALYADC